MPTTGPRILRLTSRTLSLAIVPCVVFAFWDNFFDPLAIKEILVLAMGVLTFLFWWVGGCPGGGGGTIPNPLARPLIYLCLWALISICWTGPKALAFHHWTCFAGLLLILPPVFDFGRSPVYRKTYRNLFLAVGTLLIVLAAFQLNGISLGGLLRVMGGNARTRVSVTIGHNNGVAPIVLLTSFLALGAVAETRRSVFRAALLLTTLASWILIVFFLLTRSTLIGLFLGGLLLLGLILFRFRAGRTRVDRKAPPRWAKRLVLAGMGGLIALVCVGGFWIVRGGEIEGTYNPNLARNLTDRLRTLNPSFLMVDSRARLWAAGVLMMRHHPLIGLGFSSAKYDYPFYQALFYEYHPNFPARPTPNHTERLHNDYLQWMAETGAIGTVLLLWLILVFGKTILLWLKTARSRLPGRWFSESCLVVACIAPFLDACFSFTAHIAPIAVYFPGLLMLWFAHCFCRENSPGGEDRSVLKGEETHSLVALPIRCVLAAALWAVVAMPFGMSQEKAPWIARTEVWSPITAQVYGRYFQGRMASVREEFGQLIEDVAKRLRDGFPVSRDQVGFVLEANREIRDQYTEYPPFIPFAGDALYNAGSALETIHVFYQTAGTPLSRLVRSYGPNSPEANRLREELTESARLLPAAEDLFTRSLRNYRYHDLYRRMGRVQLELARRPNLPSPELRKSLVRSGRWALETSRRIYHTDETLMAEIQVALNEGDRAAAEVLVGKLLEIAPSFLRHEVLPGLAKSGVRVDTQTSRKSLDPFAQEFFRLLLPHLTKDHADIHGVILTILDRTAPRELIEAYAEAGRTIQDPYYRLFVDFRLLRDPSKFEDLSEELSDYQRFLNEEGFGPDHRVFYLSELQTFSPEGTAPPEWTEATQDLFEIADGDLPQVVGHRMLAQAAWENGDTLGLWREHLRAHARTNLSNLPFVYDRRANAMDHAFLGIGWPVFPP